MWVLWRAPHPILKLKFITNILGVHIQWQSSLLDWCFALALHADVWEGDYFERDGNVFSNTNVASDVVHTAHKF